MRFGMGTVDFLTSLLAARSFASRRGTHPRKKTIQKGSHPRKESILGTVQCKTGRSSLRMPTRSAPPARGGFFDRPKVGQKSEKSGLWIPKCKVSGILGWVCGRAGPLGEVRRGQAPPDSAKDAGNSGNARNQRFCSGGGKEN